MAVELRPQGLELVFGDGFESAEVCAWSDVVGLPADGDETEGTAIDLGASSDCETDWQQLAALSGSADVDWFRRYIADSTCALGFDFAGSALGGARLCLFVACDSTLVSLTCAAGAVSATSPSGLPGCCSSTGALFEGLDCVGADESAHFWFRLDQAVAACTPYTVSGHF